MDQPATKQPATKQDDSPYRLVCFTNYFMERDMSEIKCTYLAYSVETCPKTGRLHMQGFAYNAQAQRTSWWNKQFNPKIWKEFKERFVHWEKCVGNLLQNEKYCSKQDKLIEFGTKPMGDGKKRSLESLAEAVVEAGRQGTPLDEVVLQPSAQATFCQYNNGISKLYNMAVTQKLRKVDKDFAPEVIYICGSSGSGKSRKVRELDPEVFMIPLADKYKWKDGYCGQDAVVYENVHPERIDPDNLLVEIDRYYSQVPVKGSFIGWRPKRIYITSVFCPECFARQAKFADPKEFTRRITKIISVGVFKACQPAHHDASGQA